MFSLMVFRSAIGHRLYQFGFQTLATKLLYTTFGGNDENHYKALGIFVGREDILTSGLRAGSFGVCVCVYEVLLTQTISAHVIN